MSDGEMSDVAAPHTPSSCPGTAVQRTASLPLAYARASTPLLATSEDVDGRDKPGHDGDGVGRRVVRFIAIAFAAVSIIGIAFAAWAISLGPLPLTQARQVSTTIIDRNGKLLRAYA